MILNYYMDLNSKILKLPLLYKKLKSVTIIMITIFYLNISHLYKKLINI